MIFLTTLISDVLLKLNLSLHKEKRKPYINTFVTKHFFLTVTTRILLLLSNINNFSIEDITVVGIPPLPSTMSNL